MPDITQTIYDPSWPSGSIEVKWTDNGDSTFSQTTLNQPWSATNITSATTTVIKASSGVLGGIVIDKTVLNGVVTIYNNTAGSGTKIATITNPVTLLQSQVQLMYNCTMSTGITIVTSTADDITVLWR